MIRKVTVGGTELLSGNPAMYPSGGSVSGTGSNAQFSSPRGLALSSTETILYIADTGNNMIRSVDVSSGVTGVFAGSGASGLYDSSVTPTETIPLTSATFSGPRALAIYGNLLLFVADTGNSVIRVLNIGVVNGYPEGSSIATCKTYGEITATSCLSGTITSLSIASGAFISGIACTTTVSTSHPRVFASDGANNVIYYAFLDTTTNIINTGILKVSGPSSASTFGSLAGMAWDTIRLNLFVADSISHVIYSLNVNLVSMSAVASHFAGATGISGKDDSSIDALLGRFFAPTAISVVYGLSGATATSAFVVIADKSNNLIREVIDCAAVFTATKSATVSVTQSVTTTTAPSASVASTKSVTNSVSRCTSASPTATATNSRSGSSTYTITTSITRSVTNTESVFFSKSGTISVTNTHSGTSSVGRTGTVSQTSSPSPSVSSAVSRCQSSSGTSSRTIRMSSSSSVTVCVSSSITASASEGLSTLSPIHSPTNTVSASGAASTTPAFSPTHPASLSITSTPSSSSTVSGSFAGTASVTSTLSPTESNPGSDTPSPSVSGGSATYSPSAAASIPVTSRSPSATVSSSATVTPTNAPFNHAPVINFNSTLDAPWNPVFIGTASGAGTLRIFSSLAITDFENNTLLNVTVRVSACMGLDALSVAVTDSSIISLGYAACTLTLVSVAPLTSTLAGWLNLLRVIDFSNIRMVYPSTGRTIQLAIWDSGNVGSPIDNLGRLITGNPLQTKKNFTFATILFNNAPFFINGAVPAWTRAGGVTPVAPNLIVNDAEEALRLAVVAVRVNCTAGDVLSLDPTAAARLASSSLSISSTWNATLCALTIAAVPSLNSENFTYALQNVLFYAGGSSPKIVSSRTISFSIGDLAFPGASNGAQAASIDITLSTDTDEPPLIVYAPTNATIFFEDTINAVDAALSIAARNGTVIAGDWDPLDVAGELEWNITGLYPLDGDVSYGTAGSAAHLFALIPTSLVAATSATPPSAVFQFSVAGGQSLAATPAKRFTLLVTAVQAPLARPGQPRLSSQPFVVNIIANRINQVVTGFGGSPLFVSVPENTPPNSVLTTLCANDPDAWQSLNYAIVTCNSSLTAVSGTLAGAPLFSLRPFPLSSVFAPPSGDVFNVSRCTSLVLTLDALDFELGERVISLNVSVTDDGVQPWTSLAARVPTVAMIQVVVKVTDVDDAPRILGIEGEPLNGFSTSGGETVVLTGTGLGLPFGLKGGVVTASYGTFNATSCVVTTRLTTAACVLAPGWGAGHAWRVLVGGVWSPLSPTTIVAPSSTGLYALGNATPAGSLPGTTSYQRPALSFITPATYDANISDYVSSTPSGLFGQPASPCPNVGSPASLRSACTAASPGASYILSGSGLPSNATKGPLAAALSVRYGLKGIEYAADCIVIRDYSRLLCSLAPGAGANLTWSVSVGGIPSTPPTHSYGVPYISAVTDALRSPTAGGGVVIVNGFNFGPADRVTTLFVSYASLSPSIAPFPVANFIASCAVTTAHVEITCTTSNGFGSDLYWHVSIGGAGSNLSPGPSAYKPPFLAIALMQSTMQGNASAWEGIASNTMNRIGVATTYDGATRSNLSRAVKPLVLLPNCSGELIDLRGSDLGHVGVARIKLGNSTIPTSTVFWASHSHLSVPCVSGIGLGKALTVEVGDTQWVQYPFAYAPPAFFNPVRVAGTGGTSNPLVVRVNATGLSACCVCAVIDCNAGAGGGVQSDPSNSAWTPESLAIQAERCAGASCEVPTGVNTWALDLVTSAGIRGSYRLLFLNESCILFSTPETVFNLTATVGGQESPPLSFDIATAFSSLPILDDTELLSGDPALLAVLPPAEGTTENPYFPPLGGIATVSGQNLGTIGTVHLTLPGIGGVACPPTFSTRIISSQQCGRAGMQTSLPSSPSALPTGVVTYGFTFGNTVNAVVYNSSYYEVGAAALSVRPPPPDAILDMRFNATGSPFPAWRADAEMKPLCRVLYYCSSVTSPKGSVTISLPPGAGVFSLHVFVPSTNQNSSNSLRSSFAKVELLSVVADSGCMAGVIPCSSTNGDDITLNVLNAPPAVNLASVWGDSLSDMIVPPGPGEERETYQMKGDFGNSVVLLTPASSSDGIASFERSARRECTITSWNTTTVRCHAPEGVSAATFQVGVYVWLAETRSDENVGIDLAARLPLRFIRGSIFQTSPRELVRTSGGVEIVLRGTSLGQSCCERRCGAGLCRAVVATVSGQTNGLVLAGIAVTSHSHNFIVLTLPPGVGALILTISLASDPEFVDQRSGSDVYALVVNATTGEANTIYARENEKKNIIFSYAYLAPVVMRVAFLKARDNPCLGLNIDGTRDSPPSPGKNYLGASNGTNTCFRAGLLSTPSDVATLIFYGFNFGFTTIAPSVTVDGVKCAVTEFCDPFSTACLAGAAAANLTLLTASFAPYVEQAITCTLQAVVAARAISVVVLTTALRSITSGSSPLGFSLNVSNASASFSASADTFSLLEPNTATTGGFRTVFSAGCEPGFFAPGGGGASATPAFAKNAPSAVFVRARMWPPSLGPVSQPSPRKSGRREA